MFNIKTFKIQPNKNYVTTILEVFEIASRMNQSSFNGEFKESLDKAATKFINKYVFIKLQLIKFHFRNKACESKSSTSPELVARYCDSLLRKSNRTLDEAAMDERFNQIMIVFKYIDDKDIFQKFYTKFFANRLIKDTYASEDAEENMINKLKGKIQNSGKSQHDIFLYNI